MSRAPSVLLLALGGVAVAAEPVATIDVPVGSSRRVHVGAPVARVTVSGRANVVDVEASPPDELEITGRRVGKTEVTAVDKGGAAHVYVVRVTPSGDRLRDRLRALFPGQKVDVQAAGSAAVLTGTVTDAQVAEQIMNVSTGYLGSGSPGGTPVINLLEISGVSQVQLEVRFAEVSRTALRELGLNFWARPGGGSGRIVGGMLGPNTGVNNSLAPDLSTNQTLGSTLQQPRGLPVLAAPLGGAFSLLAASSTLSDFPFSATLSLLSSRGFAKTLAEPTMVALSGQEASFLAGGEFPIPLTAALGQINVEFKKFGVQLRFTPFVMADDTIQLKMQTIVSDLDFTVGVRLNQVTVPGLISRESATTVRLRSGQSFAIAGLLSDRIRSNVDKVPWLGDLPILGMLFRSTSFRREETELLVVITAHLVTPRAKGDRIHLPGEDEVSDPSDLSLFLLGTGESHKPAPAGRVGFLP